MSLDFFNIRYPFLNNLAGNETGQLFAKQYGSEELLQVDDWNTFTGEVMREY
ncbi:MAG: hypothetical protein IJC02_11260 [Lachnospiraceae bacterium]|nr:hypothetical protein [Tyzzerella sp.]MBQ3165088.1 hypothetical protein [Lachnospiraceae bacterium]